MKPFKNYIATWFYRESHEEASYYPQAGGRGDSALLHSVYMQIQVPFFTTFRHYNPEAELLFFTNLEADQLPPFLTELFQRTRTEVVTLPYRNRPPKGWYKAWMNQYVYDIFKEMERRMQPGDTLLVCDADCLCRTPLHSLFQSIRTDGSTLYDLGCPQGFSINGTTLAQMEEFYTSCYGERPSSPMAYYGGEFIGLRADAVHGVNREFPVVWQFNFNLPADTARLHEEAHIFSVLAERLHLRYATANRYVKRLWTTPIYNNVSPGDEKLSVWHLPSEKKFGLYRLYRILERDKGILDEQRFWAKAGTYCGIPHIGWGKKACDFILTLKEKLKYHPTH